MISVLDTNLFLWAAYVTILEASMLKYLLKHVSEAFALLELTDSGSSKRMIAINTTSQNVED